MSLLQGVPKSAIRDGDAPGKGVKKIPSLWAEGRDRFLILQTDVFIILIIETHCVRFSVLYGN